MIWSENLSCLSFFLGFRCQCSGFSEIRQFCLLIPAYIYTETYGFRTPFLTHKTLFIA